MDLQTIVYFTGNEFEAEAGGISETGGQADAGTDRPVQFPIEE